jgi:hypothetical protein
MAKRLATIAKDNPKAAERSDVKETAADIELYSALAAFASSEAGSIVFASTAKEIAAVVSEIASGFRTLPESELRALGAKLDARITFLQSLSRASTNLDDAEAYLKELIV